jgi:hypothetical protein
MSNMFKTLLHRHDPAAHAGGRAFGGQRDADGGFAFAAVMNFVSYFSLTRSRSPPTRAAVGPAICRGSQHRRASGAKIKPANARLSHPNPFAERFAGRNRSRLRCRNPGILDCSTTTNWKACWPMNSAIA